MIILQTEYHPNISLVLFMLEDLHLVFNSVADRYDEVGNAAAEQIASVFVSQLEEDLGESKDSDTYKIAQLFDPRTYARTGGLAEITRLLLIVKQILLRVDTPVVDPPVHDPEDMYTAAVEVVEVSTEESAIVSEQLYIKNTLFPSIGRRVLSEDGTYLMEFFGGASRAEDICCHDFYRVHCKNIPRHNKFIVELLSHRCSSDVPEKIGSQASRVLDDSRTSLLPDRLQALVMSAARYNILKRKVPSTPVLPTLGVIDEDDYFDEITDNTDDEEEENEEVDEEL